MYQSQLTDKLTEGGFIMDKRAIILIQGVLVALSAEVSDWFDLKGLRSASSSGRRGLPHNSRHGKQRLHAPNDGHWHMKYHRSRH